MQYMTQQQQQQQQQFSAFVAQQAVFQQQMLSAQMQPRLPQKKKADPPTFDGKASECIDLWIFSTEQYYAQYREEMTRNSSEFVDTIFANLGPVARTWYRDFKVSLGDNEPATWPLFKAKIRERFRESDFDQKALTKLFEVRFTGSQQDYTTKFLHLLSQLDESMPEFVKRWFFQQNMRPEASSFVSQQLPETLQAAIEYAQRFEDSRSNNVRKGDGQAKPAPKTSTPTHEKKPASTTQRSKPTCTYCNRLGHSVEECRIKQAAEAAGRGKPKNE